MSYCFCKTCQRPFGNAHLSWWLNTCPGCGQHPELLLPIKVWTKTKFLKDNRWDIIKSWVRIVEMKYGQELKHDQVIQFAEELKKLGGTAGKVNPLDLSNINVKDENITLEITRDHQIKIYGSDEKVEPAPKVCTCDIMLLMSQGCKCGQMELERSGLGAAILDNRSVLKVPFA